MKNKSLRIFMAMLLAGCAVFDASASAAYTVLEQRSLGIYFLASGSGTNNGTSVSGPAAGSDSCFETALPQINDQALFAKAINDYIRNTAPSNSPFIGLGADIVQGGVRFGVNPMFMVGNMRMESQFGTSGTDGRDSLAALLHQNFNAFGRSAGSSQPNFPGPTGRLWYKYPSWRYSVNDPSSSAEKTADQPSLMRKVYLDQGAVTLSQYLAKYAPATDGNDESLYVRIVRETITDIVELAGSSLSCKDNTTVTTPASPEGP